MGGRPKQSEVKAREARLLDIATEAFLRDGLSATIEGIAATAGVSKRTIYARYPDKRALFSAAITRLIGNRTREAIILDPNQPLERHLARLARLSFETSFRPDIVKLSRLSLREAEAFPELMDVILNEAEADLAKPLAAYLDTLRRRGAIRQVDTGAVAHQFIASVFSEVNRYQFRGQPKPPAGVIDDWVEMLVDLYVHALEPGR